MSERLIPDESSPRAADLLAEAISRLQQETTDREGAADARNELRASREAIEALAQRMERHLEDEREQRALLSAQLGGLIGSLDRLVSHLEGMSKLMAELFEKASGSGARQQAPSEPAFMPGGEGVSLNVSSVPGFQSLMDIQKALTRMEQVDGVSVERYQEGDSRLVLHLKAPLTATQLSEALHAATGFNVAVEESKPELLSLGIRLVPGSSQ
jgi:hypothetical protein